MHLKKLTGEEFNGFTPAQMKVQENYSAEKQEFALSWSAVENADGYHIDLYTDQQYDTDGQPFKYSTDVNGTNFLAKLPGIFSLDTNYRYRITPYAKDDDGTILYSPRKYVDGATGANFLSQKRVYNSVQFRVNTAELNPHDTYPIYDIRNGNAIKVDINDNPTDFDALAVPDSDKELLAHFSEEHFSPGMTNYDKILYFMNWIHDNNNYATYEQYQEYTMWDGRFVNSVVELRIGQCLQFNGALAELMCQMGYDVYMIHCYSEGGYQHYRFDVNIDGIVYGMEVGDRQYDSPATGYRWMWAFDSGRPMLVNRPDKQ